MRSWSARIGCQFSSFAARLSTLGGKEVVLPPRVSIGRWTQMRSARRAAGAGNVRQVGFGATISRPAWLQPAGFSDAGAGAGADSEAACSGPVAASGFGGSLDIDRLVVSNMRGGSCEV